MSEITATKQVPNGLIHVPAETVNQWRESDGLEEGTWPYELVEYGRSKDGSLTCHPSHIPEIVELTGIRVAYEFALLVADEEARLVSLFQDIISGFEHAGDLMSEQVRLDVLRRCREELVKAIIEE